VDDVCRVQQGQMSFSQERDLKAKLLPLLAPSFISKASKLFPEIFVMSVLFVPTLQPPHGLIGYILLTGISLGQKKILQKR